MFKGRDKKHNSLWDQWQNGKSCVPSLQIFYSRYQSFNPIFFFNKCISSPNEKWLKVYTYKNWWVIFNVLYMYFLWKDFVSVSSNRQSVVWLSCDTDSRISLYRRTYYYICSKRDAWNRALPFITLHVCSHVIWRCTKWVPCNQHHPYQRHCPVDGKASIRVFVLCADRKIMHCTDRWLAVNNL